MYLRSKRIKGHTYWYLVKGHREGERVIQTVIRYVGRNPWAALKPIRFKPPERQSDYPRVIRRLHKHWCGDGQNTDNDQELYDLAFSIGQTWYNEMPGVKQEMKIALSDPKFIADLDQLRISLPKGRSLDSQAPEQDTFAHLAALSLTDPGRTLRFRQAAAWLRERLWEEPQSREALTEAGLWQLVDRRSGKKLSPKTFDRKPTAYQGPIDSSTKTLLRRYAVVEAGSSGYRLLGKRGSEYLLVRKKDDPSELMVKSLKTGKFMPLLGIRRFTDQGGFLRAIV